MLSQTNTTRPGLRFFKPSANIFFYLTIVTIQCSRQTLRILYAQSSRGKRHFQTVCALNYTGH
jgi:hypothetical protein